jgi:hypothetical protein
MKIEKCKMPEIHFAFFNSHFSFFNASFPQGLVDLMTATRNKKPRRSLGSKTTGPEQRRGRRCVWVPE